MIDGEEFHTFEEKPLRFTEKGLEEMLNSGMYTIGYDLYDMTDVMMTGMEIFHVNSEGLVTRIPIMSKEGQDILDKMHEEGI